LAVEAAKRAAYEIVESYYDAAVSGADALDARPGFAEALKRIAANGVRAIICETAIHEYAEECATAIDALDRVRTMVASGLPNIRILKEDRQPCSLDELKGLAELENEADDA
jgi:DNA invertase Pin-like site-specific DNA recombinase